MRSVLMLSSANSHTRPSAIRDSELFIGCHREMALDPRCGRRCHVDARRRAAHPALEIARARGDAYFTGAEHSHMTAITRSASRVRHDRAGLEQSFDVS